MSTVEIMSHPSHRFQMELKDFFAWITQSKQTSLKRSWHTHTPDSSTWSILWRWSSHHGVECWNGNSSLFLCLVIIFPLGFQCKSAQISLSVTSVNNRNKERTERPRYVPLRQFTCHCSQPTPTPASPRATTTTLHLILLTICRSTDQAALSRREQWEGSRWRSALAPFNAASTSNNSCLWQLCIIHLVESLSPSLLDAPLSHSPLSVSLQVFFPPLFSLFFVLLSPVPRGSWWKQEGEAGQCSIRCCLVPLWHQWFWRHTRVCLCHVARSWEFCMPSERDWADFLIGARYLNPSLQHEVWHHYPKIHSNHGPPDKTINFWLAFYLCPLEIWTARFPSQLNMIEIKQFS